MLECTQLNHIDMVTLFVWLLQNIYKIEGDFAMAGFRTRIRLGDVLIQKGLITTEQLDKALEEQKNLVAFWVKRW